MDKLFPLQTLLNLAEHKKTDAARKLGELNGKEHSVRQKLELLQGYRRDYQLKLNVAIKSGMSPPELRNFDQFIGKIDEAITQQLNALAQSKASTQAGREEFNHSRRKLQSFAKLQQHHVEAQSRIASKVEQKNLDEHAGRMAAAKIPLGEHS